MKKLVMTLLALMLLVTFAAPGLAEEPGFEFKEWNPDAPALKALIEYVESVTDESSPDYIPPVDRIATFDMDGTLCGELYPTYLEYYMLARRIFCDPDYQPDAEMLEFGAILRDHALDKSFPDGMDLLHAEHAAKAYAGMTLTQFTDFVNNQLVREVDGFENMTYANTFYLPMIEVVEYLQENDFKVFVCSGSDRTLCRIFIEGVMDIPFEQIIGMDVDMEATNENGEDGLKYVYTKEDSIVRTDRTKSRPLSRKSAASRCFPSATPAAMSACTIIRSSITATRALLSCSSRTMRNGITGIPPRSRIFVSSGKKADIMSSP